MLQWDEKSYDDGLRLVKRQLRRYGWNDAQNDIPSKYSINDLTYRWTLVGKNFYHSIQILMLLESNLMRSSLRKKVLVRKLKILMLHQVMMNTTNHWMKHHYLQETHKDSHQHIEISKFMMRKRQKDYWVMIIKIMILFLIMKRHKNRTKLNLKVMKKRNSNEISNDYLPTAKIESKFITNFLFT